MLADSKAFSGLAVDDLEMAKSFYGETLGLDVSEVERGVPLLEIHFANGPDILVYPKPDHAAANYTILNFPVDDIEQAVDELAARGVETTKYPGTDDRGINRHGGPLIAWFTDPAGNILSVLQS